ncbi:hypothetical protein ABT095_02325 [Kitasatospora sp. NPDC002227]|uniref:hypothetical protein n=1 Tax=Kitasatospora sp. NPDC002227 TaxID=3154773 RepID=UPI00331C7CC8
MTKRTKTVIAITVGTLCLFVVTVIALVNELSPYYRSWTESGMDAAADHARADARARAHRIQQGFDAAGHGSDQERLQVAESLVKADLGYVFRTEEQGAVTTVSFGVNGRGTAPDSIGSGETETGLRLCAALSWPTGGDGRSRLSDVPCPPELQPMVQGPLGWSEGLAKLSG